MAESVAEVIFRWCRRGFIKQVRKIARTATKIGELDFAKELVEATDYWEAIWKERGKV